MKVPDGPKGQNPARDQMSLRRIVGALMFQNQIIARDFPAQ